MTRLVVKTALASVIVLPLAAATHARQISLEDMALVRFQAAVDDYVALHRRLEVLVPALAVTPDAQQICDAVTALGDAIRQGRPDARAGDLFAPGVGSVLRARIAKALAERGDTVADVLADINSESPLDRYTPVVNGRFDSRWGAMVPPAVLRVLPRLPDELQYRFVDRALLLIDLDAELVVDILPGALVMQSSDVVKR